MQRHAVSVPRHQKTQNFIAVRFERTVRDLELLVATSGVSD